MEIGVFKNRVLLWETDQDASLMTGRAPSLIYYCSGFFRAVREHEVAGASCGGCLCVVQIM